jgi:hypothetical protein
MLRVARRMRCARIAAACLLASTWRRYHAQHVSMPGRSSAWKKLCRWPVRFGNFLWRERDLWRIPGSGSIVALSPITSGTLLSC